MDNNSETTPSDATRAAEEKEAQASHQADRPATSEEARSAPDQPSKDTEKGFTEMTELGAEVQGEGQVP